VGPARRLRARSLAAGLAVAGAAYLVAHRLLYGGWTVYASGDHFTGGGSGHGQPPRIASALPPPRQASCWTGFPNLAAWMPATSWPSPLGR
jgi:hypothetical protein